MKKVTAISALAIIVASFGFGIQSPDPIASQDMDKVQITKPIHPYGGINKDTPYANLELN